MIGSEWQQSGTKRKPELLIDWSEKYTFKRGRTVTWKLSYEKVENLAESEMVIPYLRHYKLQ
jgi:hypothetical protein